MSAKNLALLKNILLFWHDSLMTDTSNIIYLKHFDIIIIIMKLSIQKLISITVYSLFNYKRMFIKNWEHFKIK